MLGLLSGILCVLRNILLAVAYAGIELLNLAIAAIAALAGLLLGLLPAMPDVPQLPTAAAAATGYLAWAFPVAAFVAAFAAMLGSYLLFLAVRIGLRWVKAL